MNRKAVLCAIVFAVALGLVASLPALADDSAAAIAAGGIVPRRETRIVMAKEVLRISEKKIVVDYDFRNDTDQDVTTEVAFPVPPYENEGLEGNIQEQSFQSFLLWVDGNQISYATEAKATVKGKDITALLKANHVDIPTFGHFFEDRGEDQIRVPDYSRLSKAAQSRLLKEGVFEDTGGFIDSAWTVHLQYHWTQTFPAHSTIHIRHEYSPAVGFTQVGLSAIEDSLTKLSTGHHAYDSAWDDPGGVEELAGFCADQPFLNALAGPLRESESQAKTAQERLYAGVAYPHWVDFILTSANTWQRPIEDFTLIVERPKPEHGGRVLISFCSPANGKVEKLDGDHLRVHLTNFVPVSELHIGFFEIPLAQPVQPAAKP
ncbi:MAG: DUF4424 family protein [Terracidiphilus sp.]|jgi:hypothetical protein